MVWILRLACPVKIVVVAGKHIEMGYWCGGLGVYRYMGIWVYGYKGIKGYRAIRVIVYRGYGNWGIVREGMVERLVCFDESAKLYRRLHRQ